MKTVESVEQTGGVALMDDTTFVDCHFKDCVLLYAGGEFFAIRSSFVNCTWVFSGSAGNVVRTLQAFGWGAPQQTPSQILRPQ